MKLVDDIKKTLPEIKYILFLFLSTRIVLTIIGIFSRTILERQYGKQYIWAKYLWLDIWGVWDTFWYMDIATNGYSLPGSNPLDKTQANYAFFPLYPLLMRGLGQILGNKYYIAGLIISNICLILAGFFLYKLVKLNFNRTTALKSVKYLFIFPTAFILSGVFTESLYLALVILCFYLAKKRNWLFVGVTGFFISSTRSLGVFIIIPLLYEYLREVNFQYKRVRFDILFLLLIPLGILIFGLYNYHLTGDFFAFANIQSTWKRSASNPISILINGLYKGLFELNMRDLLEASFTIICLIIISIYYKKLDISYLLFAIYSIFIPLSTGLDSLPRFILPIFPLYILLAQLNKNRYFDQITTILLGLLQGFLMVFWSCGFDLIV